MYIIYCEHIFVYIFPCYFNWDSSFVTEVFPRKKKTKKKKRESPLRTEALCDSSFSVQWVKEILFLLICTEKQKWGRAGNLILFQTLTGHFDEFTSQLRAQERTSRYWLVTFQNGSGSGQIKKPRSEFTSRRRKFFPSPEHGSNWWKAKCREAVEASVNWREDDRVKSLTTSCCRKPVSSIQAECFFLF